MIIDDKEVMIIVKYIIYKCKGEPMYHKPLAHKLNLNAPRHSHLCQKRF